MAWKVAFVVCFFAGDDADTTRLILEAFASFACPHKVRESERWIEGLKDDDPKARARAQEQLIRMGIAALPALRKAQTDEDPEVRVRAAQAARQIVDRATDTLRVDGSVQVDGTRTVKSLVVERGGRLVVTGTLTVEGNCRIEGEIFVRGNLNVEGGLSGKGWQKTLKIVGPLVIDK